MPKESPRIASLCVYCGSLVGHDPAHRRAAARLGEILVDAGIGLVYGGGSVGLMGVLADAVLARGGRAVGVIPRHLEEREAKHAGLTELVVVDSMHERKRAMFERADAFAILPGGLGTLDETIEIITWKQLRLHAKPIVLVDGEGYWAPFVRLVEEVIRSGFARPETARLFTVVRSVEEVLPAIRRAARREAVAEAERM